MGQKKECEIILNCCCIIKKSAYQTLLLSSSAGEELLRSPWFGLRTMLYLYLGVHNLIYNLLKHSQYYVLSNMFNRWCLLWLCAWVLELYVSSRTLFILFFFFLNIAFIWWKMQMEAENFLLLFLTNSIDQLFPILTLSKTHREKCAIPCVNKLPSKRQ